MFFKNQYSLASLIMQRACIKIEDKELDFVFEVVNVQFNQLGRYQLVLTVENPLLDESGSGFGSVYLSFEDGDVLEESSICTEIIEQASLDEVYSLKRNKFVFTLPKGFCKNDKNHDVRLKVEAIRVTESESKVKAGEGFFAIYPRTNAPRINLFAGPDEDLYRYRGIMALLRVQKDYLAMHCGRLLYSVALHQSKPAMLNASKMVKGKEMHLELLTCGDSVTPIAVKSLKEEIERIGPTNLPILQNPKPGDEKSTKIQQRPMDNVNTANPDQDLEAKSHISSPPSSPQSESLPPRDIPDLFLSHTHVTESPLTREELAHSFAQEGHVSRPGAETLSVILHNAADLPPLSDGGVPLPFVIMRSHADVACDWRSHAVTRCPPHPTHNPSWEETIRVELRDTKWETHRKDVTLTVADGRTKELLAHFRLPVPYLHPFHHYHLELVQSPRDPESSGTRLYVTMVRKLSLLPRQPCFYFTGFEVLLQSVNKPFRSPVGSLIAVARIVADFNLHRSNVLLRDPRATGVSVRSVWFPDPSEYAFTVPTLTAHGWPQVSLPGSPEDQPVWNHSFLFLGRDCATVFTEGAALVLEFYPTAAKVMHMGSWHIQGPLAFSGLILDHSLYRKLMSERGLRVPHLPLQIPAVNKGCPSFITSETPPTISLVIRLIGSERPDSFLTEMDCSVLPSLDLEHPNAEESCPIDDQTHPEIAPPNPEYHTLLPNLITLYQQSKTMMEDCNKRRAKTL